LSEGRYNQQADVIMALYSRNVPVIHTYISILIALYLYDTMVIRRALKTEVSTTNLVIYWVEIWAIRRPQIR